MHEQGWTTPWFFSRGVGNEKDVFTQRDVTVEGDMALEMAWPGALERQFPSVSSGILRIEMRVRPEKTTIDITDAKASVLKVYATDDEHHSAFRWHYPFAWPEVGGNTYPRFYVIDGKGKKRKGLEYTDVRVDAGTWYKVAAVVNLDTKTWQFWVDDVELDAVKAFGHEMAWWSSPSDVSKLRINNCAFGRNWVDLVQVWHNGELHASTGFNSDEGYCADETVIGRPAAKTDNAPER